MPSSCLILSLPQHHHLFQWVGCSHHVAKVLELQLQHRSFQRVIRVDFLEDWLVWYPCCSKGSQESSPAPKFKSINSSVFFIVQLSYPYTTTGKTIALIIQTFVSKVICLLFNTLSKFVIAFLSRNNHLISWLPSPTTVILEPKKRKSVTASRSPHLFAMKW